MANVDARNSNHARLQIVENSENDMDNIADFGVDESKEVGFNSGIHNYGIVGPSAGGGKAKNINQ